MCPVCGYPKLTERPDDPAGASYEICPSCYYQFGYDDDARGIDHVTWRERWVQEGMPWRSVNPPPEHWDPAAQLACLTSSRAETGLGGATGRDIDRRGQAMVEFAGVLIVVAAIVSVLIASGVAG